MVWCVAGSRVQRSEKENRHLCQEGHTRAGTREQNEGAARRLRPTRATSKTSEKTRHSKNMNEMGPSMRHGQLVNVGNPSVLTYVHTPKKGTIYPQVDRSAGEFSTPRCTSTTAAVNIPGNISYVFVPNNSTTQKPTNI